MTQRASIPDKAVVPVVQQLSYHISLLLSADSGSLRCRRHRLILLRSTLKRFHSALPNPWSVSSKPDGDPIVLRVVQWSSGLVTAERGHLPAFGDASQRTGAPLRVELLAAQPPKQSVRVRFSPCLRVGTPPHPQNNTRIKRNSISEDER